MLSLTGKPYTRVRNQKFYGLRRETVIIFLQISLMIRKNQDNSSVSKVVPCPAQAHKLSNLHY